jgi:KTSC domain
MPKVMQSSNLQRISDYDEGSQSFTVEFAKAPGVLYSVGPVSKRLYEGLRVAGSPGQYYHNKIKLGNVPVQRIR